MRRILIATFYGFIALFWISVGLIALELYERNQISGWQDEVRERGDSIRREDAAYLEGKPLLHELPEEIATVRASGEWRPYYEIPESEREDYLLQARLLAVFLNEHHVLQRIDGYKGRAELAMLADAVRTEQGLDSVFESSLRPQFRDMLQLAFDDEKIHVDEFAMSYAYGGREVTYELLPDYDPASDTFAVLARPGVWATHFQSYRPHVYRPFLMRREEFWTNALGFRDEEIQLPKPEGVYRIVCVGGSATTEGLRNDYTYPAILERLLMERFGSNRIEVINGGVIGLNSKACSSRLEDYLALDADLYLHCAFGNDVLSILGGMWERATWRSDPWVRLWQIPRHSRFALAQSHRLFLPGEQRLDAAMDAQTMRYRKEFLDAVRALGSEVAFASFPYPDLEAATELHRRFLAEPMLWLWTYPALNVRCYTRLCAMYEARIQRFCDEHDVAYLPIAEGLRDADLYRDAAHMRAMGIERKAEVVADALEPLLRERIEAQ